MTIWRREVFESLGSTSDLCIARARAGEDAGLAIRAITQTSGRGSRGRFWTAPAGNLNLSVLLRPTLPASIAGIFSLLAGVAVADALAGVTPISLKWPNDILIGNAKVAGILIDAAPAGDRLDWLVIGIGINLSEAPEIAGRVTTTLAAHGPTLSAEAACDGVLHFLSHWLKILTGQNGPAAITEAWLARGHKLDTPISINSGQGIVSGRFAGLSPSGELLLSRNDRIERINTGEILLGQPVPCC